MHRYLMSSLAIRPLFFGSVQSAAAILGESLPGIQIKVSARKTRKRFDKLVPDLIAHKILGD